MDDFDFVKLLCPKDDFPEMVKYYKKNDQIEELSKKFANINLNKFKVPELKKKCKENNIKNYSKCKKSELIKLLEKINI